MKILIAAMAACLLAGCVVPPAPPALASPPGLPKVEAAPRKAAPPGPLTIANPGLELDIPSQARCATGWGCVVHNSPKAFRFFKSDIASEGKSSFCMEPVANEPWAMVNQTMVDPALRGTRLRLTVSMRLTDVKGLGAGPMAQVRRTSTSNNQSHRKLEKGTREWQDSTLEFDVPEDARMVIFGMTLRGTGRACFDNVRLEVLQAGKNPV